MISFFSLKNKEGKQGPEFPVAQFLLNNFQQVIVLGIDFSEYGPTDEVIDTKDPSIAVESVGKIDQMSNIPQQKVIINQLAKLIWDFDHYNNPQVVLLTKICFKCKGHHFAGTCKEWDHPPVTPEEVSEYLMDFPAILGIKKEDTEQFFKPIELYRWLKHNTVPYINYKLSKVLLYNAPKTDDADYLFVNTIREFMSDDGFDRIFHSFLIQNAVAKTAGYGNV